MDTLAILQNKSYIKHTNSSLSIKPLRYLYFAACRASYCAYTVRSYQWISWTSIQDSPRMRKDSIWLRVLLWGCGIKPWTTNRLALNFLYLVHNDSHASTLSGEEPPRKRLRRMPCPCIACDGKERDHRTIQSHLTLMDSLQDNAITTSQPHLNQSTSDFLGDTPAQSTGAQDDTQLSAMPTDMTEE